MRSVFDDPSVIAPIRDRYGTLFGQSLPDDHPVTPDELVLSTTFVPEFIT
jgi:hypothetical protein